MKGSGEGRALVRRHAQCSAQCLSAGLDRAHRPCAHEVVGSEAKVSRGEATPAVAIPGMGGSDDTSNVTDIEADEMEEHLRGLGYLE